MALRSSHKLRRIRRTRSAFQSPRGIGTGTEWKVLNGATEASNIRQNDHYAGLLQVMDDYAV